MTGGRIAAGPLNRPHRTAEGRASPSEAVGGEVPDAWQQGPDHPYPERTLHELVAEQAARTPSAVAVRQWDESLSYRDLVVRADRLADQLVRRGVGAETPVVVCTARRPHMVTAVLGVLAAGGAYVPVDPTGPAERRRLVLAEAEAAVAVVDDAGRIALTGSGLDLVTVTGTGGDTGTGTGGDTGGDGDRAGGPAGRPRRPGRTVAPDNAAYVLFTSGSTGRPKGVVVTHRSAVAFCTATASACGVGPGTRGIAFAALGFDVSVMDLFTVLLHGGAVQLVPDADRTDPARLQRFCERHRVGWGFLPPALLPLLDPLRLPDLRCLVVGAEPTAPEQVARWSAGGRRFLNWYGPTEATVSVTGVELSGAWDRPLPIGRPLANHRCYVLDERLRPVPTGVPGELYVSGVGLARGYANRPGRTAASFLPDPYVPGARMYRTGDLVVWEPDGCLGFRGRVDRQVKLAGQRVELGEVEAVLAAHPDVAQVAVDVLPGPAGAEVVAYLAPCDAPDAAALRRYCADRLPAAALPSRVVRLAALPLNASSKVDLNALRRLFHQDGSDEDGSDPDGPDQDGPDQDGGQDRSRPAATAGGDPGGGSAVDRAVADAWIRVLGGTDPDPDTGFLDAGGNSLLAMRLTAALRAATGRELPVAAVFSEQTPRAIAALLRRTGPVGDQTVPAGSPPALSGAQRRLWFLDRLATTATAGAAYNIAVAERLRGPLDRDRLSRALDRLAERHEVLRWRVPDRDGVPHVLVAPPARVPLPVEDLTAAADPESVLAGALAAEAGRRFDLAAGPLWRARLLRLGDEHHVLALTLHHLVFDGWSLDVLYRELAAGYRAAAADGAPADGPPTDGPPAVDGPGYADYVAWLAARQAARGPVDLDWWLDRLAGVPPVLDLPRDRARPPVQTHRGADRRAAVPTRLAADVHDLAARLGVTPYAVLLAAFAVLLRRLTGATDLVVGVPAADRRHPDFDGLVGFFVDTLPVRLRVDDRAPFAEQVRACASAVLEAMAHRDAPFDRVVDGLRLPRDLSRGPLVQVLFNMYNFAEARLDLPGLRTEPLPAGLPGSLFDLTLYATGRGGSLDLHAVYNPDLYSAARIGALLDTYLALLAALCASPDRASGAAPARPAASPLPRPDGPRPMSAPAPDVLARVEHAAAQMPGAVAATGCGGRLDYAGLVGLGAAVGAAVTRAGVAPGEAVGVLAARTVTLPAVLLGVLGTGCRWLVLDPAHPGDRLRRQAEAAGVRLLLACPGAPVPVELAGLADRADLAVVPLAELTPTAGPLGVVAGDRRGYLAATSGTTGEPAVVVAAERPLAVFLDWYTERFDIGPADATALLAGLGHDPLLRDCFAPLVRGGRVCVPEQSWLHDPDRLAAWLAAERVTVLHLTPQLARLLAAARTELPGVRLAVFGGDRLTDHDVAAVRRWLPAAVLVNAYGTTETPQIQSLHVLPLAVDDAAVGDEPQPMPVGAGAPGAQLLVVGPAGTPAAVGELGEVVVRSANLADGYLSGTGSGGTEPSDGRPAGTERSGGGAVGTGAGFGRNRWTDDEEDRVYRTGDLGRYGPDGTVVVAGRADEQVKVRGHRVELGEVEAALAGHPDVAAAVAVARVEAGETGIVGYAVPRRAGVRPADLREHLRSRLPEYACPGVVVVVPELPLGPNGKVDRSRLPAPPVRVDGPSDAGSVPATRTERIVAGVWREVLGRPSVSATDNFFDIGGHSLAIVAVQARLRALLDRQVHVVDLFRFPNIRALASYLDGQAGGAGLDRAARRVAAMRERRRPNPGRTRGPHS